MRRTAYIALLLTIWLVSLAALALGLDSIEHPPFVPYALIGGAYFGAISTVSLAEEISEWAVQKTAPLRQRGCLLSEPDTAKIAPLGDV